MSNIASETETEVNYFSKDFEWDQLREEVENDPYLAHHLHLSPCSHPLNQNPQKQQQQQQQQQEDSLAWQSFHARHATGKFFKERRYLLKEFPELASCEDHAKVLEVGCGCGSTALPILRGKENIILYACDYSNEALERAKEIISSSNILSAKSRFHPFQCDFSTLGFPAWLACNACQETFMQKQHPGSSDAQSSSCCEERTCCTSGVDFITLIFTLSAIPLQRMPMTLAQCFAILKPGGLLLFRDYGLYDMTMLRFEPEQRVGYREYLRRDGTRSYFFCLDSVRKLASAAGFTELELEYCCVKSMNRRNGKVMRRVWVHGKFQKP